MSLRKQVPKVGAAYRRIARLFVEDVDKRRFNEILEDGDLWRIESYVTVEEPLKAAVDKLREQMSGNWVCVPDDLYEIMMFGENPMRDLMEFREQLREHRYSDLKKAAFAMMILETVHDEWVACHQEEFFMAHMLRYRKRYIEFALIGFDEAMRYLPFLETIFDLFGWKIDQTDLLLAYHRVQEAFNTKWCLRGHEDLVRYVMEGDYQALSQDIARVYRTEQRVVEKILMAP